MKVDVNAPEANERAGPSDMTGGALRCAMNSDMQEVFEKKRKNNSYAAQMGHNQNPGR